MERRFAVILEDANEVVKWFKPTKGVFKIDYKVGHEVAEYVPDFVVETETAKFLCEPKRSDDLEDEEVQAKAQAAATWCKHATQHSIDNGGKPWSYLLIPHDQINDTRTFKWFVDNCVVTKEP